MNLTDIDEIKTLLARHNFRFSKSLGQNFLCAAWVPERTADAAMLDSETGVLEVGPGIGCLTVQLAQRAQKVVSVELDSTLKPVLAETLNGTENTEVVYGDVMNLNLKALVEEKFSRCEKVHVCANLPYNITSPVLTKFAQSGLFECVTVMIQKEVARRICARENTADYGAFTVLMQWFYEPELLYDVPPSCFIPAPKVTSSVIRLQRRSAPPVSVLNEQLLFSVVRAAFNQRRKTLCNALCNGLGLSRETVANAIQSIGLPETVRGEALSISQFALLSDALEKN